MKIRAMRREDISPVLSLWKQAGLPARPKGRDSKPHLIKQLSDPASIYFVATSGTEILGVILGTHDARKGWINRLAVHPDHQHHHIAADLVQKVEEECKKRDIHIVSALIEDWNKTSLSVFDKLGYTLHKDIFYLSKRESPET